MEIIPILRRSLDVIIVVALGTILFGLTVAAFGLGALIYFLMHAGVL